MTTQDSVSYSYLIIGSGRVARHLSHYFDLLKIAHTSWNRNQSLSEFNSKLENASVLLLAISDDALENFYKTHLATFPEKTVIHFSGALVASPMIAAHPLMTFGLELYELEFYKRIHFCVTGADSLQDLIPQLPNSSSTLFAFEKSKYHALCVLGGNFSSLLIGKMLEEFQKLGLPESASLPYIEKIVSNTFASPAESLTGPLVRKDVLTVEKNLQALVQDPYLEIYKSFLNMLWPEYPKK